MGIHSIVKQCVPIKTSVSGMCPLGCMISTSHLKGQMTNKRYTRMKGSPHYVQDTPDNKRPLSLQKSRPCPLYREALWGAVLEGPRVPES